MKSSQVFEYLTHSSDYGISISGEVKPDFTAIVARSRNVANGMSKGVQFLFKKNNIEHIKGYGRLAGISNRLRLKMRLMTGIKKNIPRENIILATGARSKELPNLKQDGKKIIGYREAMTLEKAA